MKLYLDTNIVLHLIAKDYDCFDRDTHALFADAANLLYTSTVCVQELIHLRQIGKVLVDRKRHRGTPVPIVEMLDTIGIALIPITTQHLRVLDNLPLVDRHHDPNDRLIIAQALADAATLVSADRLFPRYRHLGLLLHENRM